MARRRARQQRKPKATHSDLGTPERRQHGLVIVDRVEGEGVLYRDRAIAEQPDPLQRYRKQRTLTSRQYTAGRIYRELDAAAIKRPCVTGAYGETISGGTTEMFVVTLEMKFKELQRAEKYMGMYCDTVKHVCIFEHDLVRGRVPWLKVGLDRLADFFRV